MWIGLSILALILVFCLAPIGYAFTVVQSIILWNHKYFSGYSKNLAGSLDQFGNVVMAPLFNEILIKKFSPHKFGNMDEKISSVLGRNKEINAFKYLGERLDAWLNGIDPNHSIKSIGS